MKLVENHHHRNRNTIIIKITTRILSSTIETTIIIVFIEQGKVIYKDKDEVTAFINSIGNLKASGGGDCPEFAYEGMFGAIDGDIEPESPLFIFTDASPKDGTPENMEMLLGLAEENEITINFFTEESCSNPPHSTFEVFKETASETGGSYLRIKESELKRLANFTDTKLGKSLSMENILCSVFFVRASLTSKIVWLWFPRKTHVLVPTLFKHEFKIVKALQKVVCFSRYFGFFPRIILTVWVGISP